MSRRRAIVILRKLFLYVVALMIPVLTTAQTQNSDRPKLPYNMMGLGHDELDAYDSKAEPVATATAALVTMNRAGWQLIQKQYPRLGTSGEGQEKHVHADDITSMSFFANYANEDATLSPIPLLSAIASLPESSLSGRAHTLHLAALDALPTEDFSAWTLPQLRSAVESMTTSVRTAQGTKYRSPKPGLSFKQAARLYCLTLVLLRKDDKWVGKTDSPPPDMADFIARLSHQVQRQIGDGETAGFLLYRPGIPSHGLSKDQFEERADVVLVSRSRNSFHIEQFPVYLTADAKEWSPDWITAKDEINDSTLLARKFEHDWTRLDGPYLWFRPDLLSGAVVYKADISIKDEMVITAEREIASRGAVKRGQRPRDYNPLRISAFSPGRDEAAVASGPLSVEPLAIEDQVRALKCPPRYFSNRFRAWCAYGLWESGMAPDGHTWISIPNEPPRPSGAGQ